ncbi:MAG: hypothetical protein ACREFQ_23040 [Stellaceae bacterium]
MIVPAALPVALLLLTAMPVEGPLLDEPQPLAPGQALPENQAQSLALQLGTMIGTAMECAAGQDVDGAEAKAEAMVHDAAMSANDDPIELDDRFHDAMAAARDKVLGNQANCGQAKAALQKFVGQQPD